ncbi:MAG: DUF4955 domain-containing protein, partial [Leeuwenhoekiella sp.]
MKTPLFLLIALITMPAFTQTNVTPAWRDFTNKRTSGDWGTTTISDFSFAGYKNGNVPIPNTSGWNVVNVSDHGARPDDGKSDNNGIQKAIEAAENSGRPSVVLFESGRYLINRFEDGVKSIYITKNNIVLKGKGSGTGGTEIFCESSYINPEREFGNPPEDNWAFIIRPENSGSSKRTKITEAITRGSFDITVSNASEFKVGDIVTVRQRDPKNIAANGVTYPSTATTDQWTRLNDNGFTVREFHSIKSISGNKITFDNPMLINLPKLDKTDLFTENMVENIGLEKIRFSGNWSSYGENFIHHKPGDFTHDQGWSGILFEGVANSWVVDCDLRDWNESVAIDFSYAMTVSNSRFSGKKAHSSIACKSYSTCILIKDMVDAQNSHHGPGGQIGSAGVVIKNYKLSTNQSIDLHAATPYAYLFENMNGILHRNGGNFRNHPHAGPYMVFWNFEYDSQERDRTLDFWSVDKRNQHTFANPTFVGFTYKGDKITLKNTLKNESVGKKVYPLSLYEAQLQLRKYDGYMSASNSKSNRPAVRANDDKSNTAWETDSKVTNQWIMLDFGTAKTLDEIFIDERSSAIGNYKIQHWKDNKWNDLNSGNSIGSNKTVTFSSTAVTVIRLLVESKRSGSTDSSIIINTFGIANAAANQEPTVSITTTPSSSNGSLILDQGYDLYVRANASDTDGTINNVKLFIDNTLLRQEGIAPYEWGHDGSPNQDELNGLTSGSYTIRVEATDNDGAKKSASLNLTIRATADYTPPAGYTLDVNEGQTVNVSGTMNIAFGANGQFIYLYNQTSNVGCDRATFGGDPTPGVPKKCFVKSKGDIALGTYFLKNKASGNYLDSDGTTVRVNAKAGGSDQQWKLAIPQDLHYNIDNMFSGRGVLDANANDVVQGSSTESPSTANDKMWTVESLGNSTYRFKNAQYDEYLAEKNSSNVIEYT